MRTVLLAFKKVKPLVGAVDPRFENKGIELPEVEPRTRHRDVARSQVADRRRRAARLGSSADRAVAIAPAEAELRADVARELPRRRHHPRLDLHFLRLAVKLRQQAVDDGNHFRNVVDDHGVGALIRNHIATRREELLYGEHHVLGVGVAQETRDRNFLHGQRFRFHLGAPSIRFFLQRIHRGDAQNVAFQFPRQVVVLEHDVQSLVPRHIIEHDSQSAVHVGIEHHVQAADLMDQAEKVFQIHILQVHRNRLARVLGAGRGRLLSSLRLLLRRQIDCGLDANAASAGRSALR